MNFFKDKISLIKKKTLHYFNPNENPTDLDKYAFNLLDKAEVQAFVEFMDKNNVNVNVLDFNKTSLLIKAQGIPGIKNPMTKKFTKSELQDKAIIAIEYLIKRGVDVNYQNKKNGITALLSASHWGYTKIAQFLLKNGADPNLGSLQTGFCTNPLLSAVYKNHKQIVNILISYGADPYIAEKYAEKSSGFKLSGEDSKYLHSAHTIYKLVYKRRIQIYKQKKTVLSQISDGLFREICQNV